MKIKGIASSASIFGVFLVASWAFNASSLATLQRQFLHWNYFSHVLMVVFSVGAMALSGVDMHSYGFTLRQWRSDLSIAIVCLVVWVGFFPSFVFSSLAGNALANALIHIAASLLALGLAANKKTPIVVARPGRFVFSCISAVPYAVLGANMSPDGGLIFSTIIFQFFFAGFGEEILFRGYIQSRLNEDFGKPWSFKGVSFGPGLLISATLFGVLHMLNPFNPFTGSYDLAMWWAVTSGVSGLLFGFVREKTGTVVSASLAHGLIDLGQVIPLLL
jgi:membrane protease YdiL (CAAX protease family)